MDIKTVDTPAVSETLEQKFKIEKVKIEVSDENVEVNQETPSNDKQHDADGKASQLQQDIIRQIEYYFGDYNLPKDAFLTEQVKLDDGWISIETMLKFSRLKQLTSSPEAVLEALKKSTSGLMEVCPDAPKIRRSKDRPVPEETPERVLERKARTVYCKGFPKDGTTLDKVLAFFKQFPTVENTKLRFYKKGEDSLFKGSVTATFSKKEEADSFMAKESVKYNDYALQRQWFFEWEAEKTAEFEARKSKKANKNGDTNGKKATGEDFEKVEKIVLARGTVLKLTGLPERANRDTIKNAFASSSADIAYVEINQDHTAYVRLRGDNDAKTVLGKLEEAGKVKVADTLVEVSVLEGEEEDTYIGKAEEAMNNRAANPRENRGGRGGGRGRGRGRSRGGGRGGYRGNKRSGSPTNNGGGNEKKTRGNDD